MEELLKNLIKDAVKEAMEEMELNKTKSQEIMSQKELAKYLGVSQAWVSVNKDKCHIPYFIAGGSKFCKKDIDIWIEENKNEISIYNKHRNILLKIKR